MTGYAFPMRSRKLGLMPKHSASVCCAADARRRAVAWRGRAQPCAADTRCQSSQAEGADGPGGHPGLHARRRRRNGAASPAPPVIRTCRRAPSGPPPPVSKPALKGCGRSPPSATSRARASTNSPEDLTPDLRIMDLIDAQPEFTKAFWDYLDILVSDARIAGGRDILAKNKAVFDKVEKQYGVDRYIITAIWGVEFELRHARRRPAGAALDRDARLHRPPPSVFPRRIPFGAGNPASWRSEAGATDRLLGRRVRSDAVHADVVQALCRRFRRRRPPRRRQQSPPI